MVRLPVGVDRGDLADASRPSLAAVEKATVPTKDALRHHWDSPHERIGTFPAPKDVELRVIVTLAKDDLTRVAKLHLDVSDLRGWKPKPIRCWDELSLLVFPRRDRFEPGTWTVTATRPGAAALTFTCKVPADVLDRGTCTPAGDAPPGAEMGSSCTSLTLHLDGQPATVDVEARHDGQIVRSRSFAPKYATVPTPTTPKGTCTNAHETFMLRVP